MAMTGMCKGLSGQKDNEREHKAHDQKPRLL
jgi:hypothetical protein